MKTFQSALPSCGGDGTEKEEEKRASGEANTKKWQQRGDSVCCASRSVMHTERTKGQTQAEHFWSSRLWALCKRHDLTFNENQKYHTLEEHLRWDSWTPRHIFVPRMTNYFNSNVLSKNQGYTIKTETFSWNLPCLTSYCPISRWHIRQRSTDMKKPTIRKVLALAFLLYYEMKQKCSAEKKRKKILLIQP